MKFPIYFDGDISLDDVANALASRGIHLVGEAGGRWTARHVPAFLRKPEAESNVVPIKRRKAK